jgi:hypothetical protein
MESSSIALGVLGTALAGLLGYSYFQRQKIGEMKDYKDEVCRNLYGHNKIFSERELDRELSKPILSSAQQDEHDRLEDCRRIIFPRKWFGGKKTRKVRKDTFMSRRR